MVQTQKDTLAYWQSKSRDCNNRIPSRKDIKEYDLGRIMSDVIILDVLSEPLDFKYRLIGTNLLEYLNGDHTGKCFSEFDGKGENSKIWQLKRHVVTTKRPIFCNVPYVGPKSDFMRVSTLMLPLASDHITIDKIMAVLNFETRIDLETKEVIDDETSILKL